MKQVVFLTGNSEKFLTAKHAAATHGVQLEQKNLEVVEIQSEDPEVVAVTKGKKAFEAAGQPVVVTDDSWVFSGLNGFPGVYMHSMNTWFTPEDFLRLTLPLEDRKVTLMQYLVYTDACQQKVFCKQTNGELLKEARGTSKYASHTITTLEGDNGLSIAEVFGQTSDKSDRPSGQIWHEFFEWFSSQK